jgi:hypothetical protein
MQSFSLVWVVGSLITVYFYHVLGCNNAAEGIIPDSVNGLHIGGVFLVLWTGFKSNTRQQELEALNSRERY